MRHTRNGWLFHRICVALGLLNVKCLRSNYTADGCAGSFRDGETGVFYIIELRAVKEEKTEVKKKPMTINKILKSWGMEL